MQASGAHRLGGPAPADLTAARQMPGHLQQRAQTQHAANILARSKLLTCATVNPDATEPSAVPGMDATAARRWRQLPRTESPWLHEEVATRMVQRLQWFREPPASWLHWEPVLGGLQAHARLREQLPQASWHVMAEQLPLALEATRESAARSWNPLQWRRAPAANTLPADGQVAMLWANMVLHHEPQPLPLLKRWHGLIQTNGFLLFSCLGPDTLRELRTVYAQAGWHEPAHAFTDMHDWGDMLVEAGYAEPVMDMERIRLTFATPQRLLQELAELGCNLHPQRFPALRGRHWRRRLHEVLQDKLGEPDEGGQLALTFEIIYGHAYKPKPRVRVSASSAVSLEDMRAMLREGSSKG